MPEPREEPGAAAGGDPCDLSVGICWGGAPPTPHLEHLLKSIEREHVLICYVIMCFEVGKFKCPKVGVVGSCVVPVLFGLMS